jgi:hypothetical protein
MPTSAELTKCFIEQPGLVISAAKYFEEQLKDAPFFDINRCPLLPSFTKMEVQCKRPRWLKSLTDGEIQALDHYSREAYKPAKAAL